MTVSALLALLVAPVANPAAPAAVEPNLIPELAHPCELRQPDDPVAVEIAAFCARLPNELKGMRLTDVHVLGDALAQDQLDQAVHFHSFAIQSSAAVKRPQSDAGVLQHSLRGILKSRPTSTPDCFTPQHGVALADAAGARFDVLVSFACSNYMVVSRSGDWFYMGSFAVDERKVWDRFFRQAGIAR